MRPVSSYPEQRSAKTAISHACRIAIDYISIDPHSRHSIRSDPYLSTSRRADKARSIRLGPPASRGIEGRTYRRKRESALCGDLADE